MDAKRNRSGQDLCTVLVVDDEEGILTSLARVLARAGYRVETWRSPRRFLEEARWSAPCCVVLDVHMPEMKGPEVQARLSAVDPSPAVVFMSGAADVPTSVQVMKAGAVDFIDTARPAITLVP